MEQTDLDIRDASLQSVLDNLLIFYKVMAMIQPNRSFLPYEAESRGTLPIIRREKHSIMDGDPTWIINEKHFLNGRRKGIIARMYDPKHQNFHIYGGAPRAGPRVDFNFTGHFPFRYNVVAALQFAVAIEIIMGRPSEEETIDKISNSKGYVLPNIRWADKSMQARNRGTYKYRYADPPVRRPSLPQFKRTSQSNPILQKSEGKHRGSWNESAKPKTQMRQIRQMIASVFSKKGRFTAGGRQRRRMRNSTQARRTMMHLLTPEQQRHAHHTFSRYTSTSTTVHIIRPADFKERNEPTNKKSDSSYRSGR